MRRREFLAGSAALSRVAEAFGIGQLGADFGRAGLLGGGSGFRPNYFVNLATGSDSNNGRTPATAWQPTKRKSALVGIKRSGLDLVPSKKTPKGKLATKEEYAAIKFRAWKRSEKAMNALGAGWHDRGVAARFAFATMLMPRKQMIEFHAETDHGQVDQL